MSDLSDIATRNGLPRKLTEDELIELVRELVTEGGRVTFRKHALERMEQRDVTTAQVLQVLRRGELIAGPKWSETNGNWEFTMRADTAGEEVTVGAAIEVEQLMGQVIAVITVIV